jgi:predicted DNA-binding transcriptional regulator AlpA
VDAVNERSDSAMFAAIAPLLPALRKAAGRFGFAVQYCSRRRLVVALQRGRIIVQKCESASLARSIESGIRSDAYLSIAEVEQLVGRGHIELRKLERNGRFPRRKKIEGRRYGWLARDVEAWIVRRDVITLKGSGGIAPSLAAAIAPAPSHDPRPHAPCEGCRERLRTIEIDDFGGEGRLIDAIRIWHAAEGRSPCSGLCKPPARAFKPQP